ncbi:MAG: BsuPI-related putative proteinase inhibitor [Gemmatimonadota bacterium]
MKGGSIAKMIGGGIPGSLLSGAAIVLMVACVPQPAEVGPVEEDTLLSSVQVHTTRDTVSFVLQVTNTSRSTVVLTFPTGQTYDFLVRRNGQEVWRWSAGQMFTQAMQEVRLSPGETVTHQAAWAVPAAADGEYEAVGILPAIDDRVEQAARFELP